jgi:RNA polymerase sigma-70 factor, ECF subfamily
MTNEPPDRFHRRVLKRLWQPEPKADDDRHYWSEAAFRRELLGLLPRLRAHALVLSTNRDEADDLLQETCVKAMTRWRQFSGTGPLAAWLFRIMQNTWRDQLRSNAVRTSDPLPAELPDARARPEDRVELGEVRRAIGALPPEQRAALLLVAVEGLSYREAAGAMTVPIGTVRSRVSRARAALVEQLKMDCGNE